MGGVDRNDQLLKYSAFNKRSAKWWKKLLFRLLNVGMVNVYICYKERMSQHSTRPIVGMVNAYICYKERMSQHSTRPINQTECIHQMLTALIISVLQREEVTLTLTV